MPAVIIRPSKIGHLIRSRYLKPILSRNLLISSILSDWPRGVQPHQFWINNGMNIINMVNTGLFNIVGHLDLPKKFMKAPTKNIDDIVWSVLRAIKNQGMAIELNTAGLRKPVKEIYPSKRILEMCYQLKIPLTLGSDAHDPEEVAYAFPPSIDLLKSIGYKEIITFKKRKPFKIEL